MTPQMNLDKLNMTLPPAPKPAGAYVPCVQSGNLVFVSGQLPIRDGKLICTGKVPTDADVAAAQEGARVCVLNGLAILQAHLGNLEKVRQVVRLEVFVNSAPGFTDQPQVANGASELLTDVFGDAGKHSRMAMGVAELPLNAAVELALIVACE